MPADGERVTEYLSYGRLIELVLRSLRYANRPAPQMRTMAEAPAGEPLVSVIIPTYNWSSVLRLAIRSVLWQTEQSFEILVMGDGCTDDSETVVKSFRDARIRWHNLPRNSGSQSAPNNAGLAVARGRYIAYLGHDDVWHPEHLRSLLHASRRRSADVASSLVEMIGPGGTNYRVVAGVYPLSGYNGEKGLPPSGLMHNREVGRHLGGWKDYRTVWRNPDTDFVYRAWKAGFRFVTSRELTVFKFNSALRKNSYIDKPCHEQAAYLEGMQNSRWFPLREALSLAFVHGTRRPMREPAHAPPPDPHTPGWKVTQYRKFRGLE